jgi:hypothetical protein
VLQAPELSLDGGAATVELAPARRLAREERMEAVGTPPGARLMAAITETETVIKRILPYLRRRGYDEMADFAFRVR